MDKLLPGHEYVVFLPSDDGIPPESLEHVQSSLASGGATIVELYAVDGLDRVQIVELCDADPR